jgi:hypothetical protein
MTSSGIERATFRLVGECLNRLRYRVHPWYYTMYTVGLGKKWPWPNPDTITEFACRNSGGRRETWGRMAGVPVEIRTQHLPSRNRPVRCRSEDPELACCRPVWLRYTVRIWGTLLFTLESFFWENARPPPSISSPFTNHNHLPIQFYTTLTIQRKRWESADLKNEARGLAHISEVPVRTSDSYCRPVCLLVSSRLI